MKLYKGVIAAAAAATGLLILVARVAKGAPPAPTPPPPAPPGLGNLYGIITDAKTNKPLQASIELVTFGIGASSADGTYEFLNIEPGFYTIHFYKDGYDMLTIWNAELKEGNNELSVQLEPIIELPAPPTPPPSMPATAGIYGKVTDATTTQPISGAIVYVASLVGAGTLSGKTDTYGNYTISSIEPGLYDIDIEKLGYEPARWRDLYLSEGEVRRFDAQLVPKALYTLNGRVTHSITGSPVGSVIVSMYNYETGLLIGRTTTDGQGYYSITNIEVGRVDVRFAKEGYVTHIYKNIVLSQTLNHKMAPEVW